MVFGSLLAINKPLESTCLRVLEGIKHPKTFVKKQASNPPNTSPSQLSSSKRPSEPAVNVDREGNQNHRKAVYLTVQVHLVRKDFSKTFSNHPNLSRICLRTLENLQTNHFLLTFNKSKNVSKITRKAKPGTDLNQNLLPSWTERSPRYTFCILKPKPAGRFLLVFLS